MFKSRGRHIFFFCTLEGLLNASLFPRGMHPRVEYLTDQAGIIRSFSNGNGSSQEYVGAKLFNFFTPSVRPLLSGVHMAVLRSGSPLTLEHLCVDADAEHRMRLHIEPRDDHVHYTSELLESRARTVPLNFDRDEGPLVALCSWCTDVARAPTEKNWRPLVEVATTLPAHYRITHSMCDPCYDTILASFE